jgi:hypothetical protein
MCRDLINVAISKSVSEIGYRDRTEKPSGNALVFALRRGVTRAPIFTVGHSDRSWENLVETLQAQRTDTVVDVRTTPFSRRHPQFNKSVLDASLPRAGMAYLYLGVELGARRTERNVLSADGQVSFVKVGDDPSFKQALGIIEERANEGKRLAILCAEGEPWDCHRFPMIAYQLERDGFEVLHILRNRSVMTHGEVEQEMVRRFAKKLPQPSLFGPPVTDADQVQAAYLQLNRAIGYKPDQHADRNLRT